jgi:cytochrome P450
LWQEGISVIGAGAETTATALSKITFYLLNSPEKLAKLRAELMAAMPDPKEPAKLRVIEQLPYLVSFSHPNCPILLLLTLQQSAVVLEGLR